MNAIDRLKQELAEFPLVPGALVPPILRAGLGAVPPGLIEVLLELIARVEALESEAS